MRSLCASRQGDTAPSIDSLQSVDSLDSVYSETFNGRLPRSLRTSKYQLIYNGDDDSWEFYRLEEDPRNVRDSYGVAGRTEPGLLAELEARLRERMAPQANALEGVSVELDAETIEQLEELGYLQ